MNPLFSLSQITLVDRKILVSEWICLSNSVITLVDKRSENRVQLILIVRKKDLESLNMRYLVTVKLNDRTFIHLISESKQTICSWWKSERSFKFSSTTNIRSRWVFPSPFNLDISTVNWTTETKEFIEKRSHKIPLCLVGVCHSNLVFVEKPDLHTPLQQIKEQTLTTSK